MAFELRLDQGDAGEVTRFKDGWTHYEGRRIKLPSFWIAPPGQAGEKITLSLTSFSQVVHDVAAARAILVKLAGELEMDTAGVDAAAAVLQQHCRDLAKWKEKPKRDVRRRDLPANLRGKFR